MRSRQNADRRPLQRRSAYRARPGVPPNRSPVLAIRARAVLVAHARRSWMPRHFKTLAGVGDFGAADFQDREILAHVVSGQYVLAIRGEQDSLGQSADLDILGLGHLLAVDLQDREAAVLLVEKRLLVVGAAQDGGDREIAFW